MLGFLSRILLSEMLLNFVEELNIILIEFFFCGWYILNIGRYYCFLLLGKGGVFFVCFFLNILLMNIDICFFFVGFCFRLWLSVDV